MQVLGGVPGEVGGVDTRVVLLEPLPERLDPEAGFAALRFRLLGLGFLVLRPDGRVALAFGALDGGLLGDPLAQRRLHAAAPLRQPARRPFGDLGDVILHGDPGGDAGAGGPAPLGRPLGAFEGAEFGLGNAGGADPVGDAGGRVGRHHVAGHDEDGPDAAVRGGAQRDVHVVRLAQAAHDREAEARVLAEDLDVLALLGLLQQALQAVAGLLVQGDAGVLDLDAHAGLHLDGGDVHLGGGRRVAGGVVEEFGGRVDDRLDGGALDVDLADGVQLDAPVLQDPGHGAAQHAVEGDGVGPLAAGTAAAEHGDRVGEASDQGGAVVDAQQVVEDLGVAAVVLLHLPQFVGLLVDDGLDAPGDADERALQGVALEVFLVDDVEHGADQPALRLGGVAHPGVDLEELADHLFG